MRDCHGARVLHRRSTYIYLYLDVKTREGPSQGPIFWRPRKKWSDEWRGSSQKSFLFLQKYFYGQTARQDPAYFAESAKIDSINITKESL